MTTVLILLVSGEERPTHTMETLILQTEQGTCANKIHITAEAACQLSKLNRSHKKYSDDQPSWSLYIPILHHSTGISIQIFPDPNPLDVPGQAHLEICNASRVMSWFAS